METQLNWKDNWLIKIKFDTPQIVHPISSKADSRGIPNVFCFRFNDQIFGECVLISGHADEWGILDEQEKVLKLINALNDEGMRVFLHVCYPKRVASAYLELTPCLLDSGWDDKTYSTRRIEKYNNDRIYVKSFVGYRQKIKMNDLIFDQIFNQDTEHSINPELLNKKGE